MGRPHQVLRVWSGILRRVPSTVLWVLDWGSHAVSNLRVRGPSTNTAALCASLIPIRAAAAPAAAAPPSQAELLAAGLSESRLVVSPVLPIEQHLARIGAADLFLDTLSYGGHTTATDALWAGKTVPLASNSS